MPSESPPASVSDIALPVHGFDGIAHGQYSSDKSACWSWSNVAWTGILKSQTVAFATLIVCSPAIVLLIVFQYLEPASRPYLLYDATISYAANTSTIPYWCAWVIPGLVFLLSLLTAECWLLKARNHNLSNGLSLTLHHSLDSIIGLIVTACLTDVGKVTVGFLRPDFLSRCYPDGLLPNVNAAAIGVTWGANVTAPLCAEDTAAVTDGKKSFPSGHSSSAAFWAGYVAIYWLYQTPFIGSRAPQNGSWGALWRALSQGLALLLVLTVISWAYGIGLSRIIDNKHHAGDVVGGWLLGGVIGSLFACRAMSCRVDALVPQEGSKVAVRREGLMTAGTSISHVAA